MKRKQNIFIKALNNMWFMKLWRELVRDKSKCKVCKKNPADSEYDGKCFDCVYKSGLKNIR